MGIALRLVRRRTGAASALLGSALLLGALAAQEPEPEQAAPALDAARLRTGRFVYRILRGGEEVAKITCTVRRQPYGNVEFTGEATGDYSQRWEAMATASLVPISATLRIGRGPGERSFRLSYDGEHVTGHVTGGGTKESAERTLDERLPAGTVDQRIDWAAVLSSRLEPGRTFDFSVYDPWSGVSRVVGTVGEAESVRVAAGKFDVYRVTYKIESARGAEPYTLLATREEPRISVREDFPSGTVSELVEIRDSE